jgi:hypothetical protein
VKDRQALVLEIGKRSCSPLAGRAKAEQGCNRGTDRFCSIADAIGDILASRGDALVPTARPENSD